VSTQTGALAGLGEKKHSKKEFRRSSHPQTKTVGGHIFLDIQQKGEKDFPKKKKKKK